MPADDECWIVARRLVHRFTPTLALDGKLAGVTAAAVSLIEEVDFADVVLVEAGTVRSVAPTAAFLPDLHATQVDLQQGPFCAAAAADAVVRCPDLTRDPRWPAFSADAVEAGVFAMVSFPLRTGQGGAVGALNLFSLDTVEVFDPTTEAIGALLAAHAAVVLIATAEHQQFQSALASRDVIGQAKGVLMERFTVDAQRAFDMLSALSQEMNVPVRALAERLADTSAQGGEDGPLGPPHHRSRDDGGVSPAPTPGPPSAISVTDGSGGHLCR